MLWSCLIKCWSDKVYVPPLAHRLWKLTLQLYARYAKFLDEVLWNLNDLPAVHCKCSALTLMGVAQVLMKTPTPEVTKEPTRPLPSSASSTSSRTSVDEGGSESGSPGSLSTKQLVFIAADIQRLQEKVCTPKNKLNTPFGLTLTIYLYIFTVESFPRSWFVGLSRRYQSYQMWSDGG